MEKTILIVDDERDVLSLLKLRLESSGYRILVAESAEEALDILKKNIPDLIFMDIGLKGEMDGIDTAAQIRSLYRIPVIFLTAFVDEKTLDRAKATVPAGYLTKPFEENDLRIAIEVGLYRAKLENQREVLIIELQEAMSKIKTLSGLIPICAWCKKIRDDQGYWQTVEQYVKEHSQAEFTHGMCPECQKKYMPDDV